jgi:iron complex transport system permease protein
VSKFPVPRPATVLTLLAALVVVAVLFHVSPGGEYHVSVVELVGEIFRGPREGGTDRLARVNSILWDLRLPRVCVCLLVGALLGSVGSAFQALLRNPLADPFVLGVSGGAAVGSSLAFLFGFGVLLTTGFGFVGGMLALALVYALATQRGIIDVNRLILAGTVTGSLLSSMLTLVLLSAGKDTNVVLRRLMGDMGDAAYWPTAGLLLVVLLIGFPLLMIQSRNLNALALGGDAARRLGVDPSALARLVLLAGGFMTAATVGTVGIVGFLGLVAPHLARRLLGVDWRWSLPGSLLMGSLLLVFADLLAQRAMPSLFGKTGLELPVGAITSLLGAPTLLVLLRKKS